MSTNHGVIKYRRDIDGLRAIAVLAVIFFHAFTVSLKGGFVGVDVFFVISGFLITTILIKDFERGQFSLLDFYKKRIARIFPSLITILTFCLIASWFILFSNEFVHLSQHVMASAGFISNFKLLSEANYFDVSSDLKPLLHLWSLAIEEQFYLFWPCILMFSYVKKIKPIYILILLVALSFISNIYFVQQDTSLAFYSPLTRSWELLVGGILSVVHSKGIKGTQTGRNLISVLAGILLLTCFIFFTEKIISTAYWAIAPIVASAALIYVGENATFNKYILCSKVMTGVGLISYPLYLWHWPLISFLRIMNKDVPRIHMALSVGLSFFLAYLTYRFIEKPFKARSTRQILFLISGMACVAVMSFIIFLSNGFPFRHFELEDKVKDLGNEQWKNAGMISDENCLLKFGPNFKTLDNLWYCKIGSILKAPTIALMGDSHGNSLFPGMNEVYTHKGENLINLGRGGCPPFYKITRRNNGRANECSELVSSQLNYLTSQKQIHTVILSASAEYVIFPDIAESLTYKARYPTSNLVKGVFSQALYDTLMDLSLSGKNIVFILDWPRVIDPFLCINQRPFSFYKKEVLSPCSILKADFQKQYESYFSAVREVLIHFPQVRVWNSSEYTCDKEHCWVMKQGHFLYRDDNHFSDYGSKYLAKKFLESGLIK